MARLGGRIALITGAAQGIGEAIARAFAAEGAFVYATDLEEVDARRVADDLGDRAAALTLDVRSPGDWNQATQRILDEHGALNIVVNNAGITGLEHGARHDPEHASLEHWHEVHRTNLDGLFLGCRAAIRAMRKSGSAGAIINMSSRSGMVGIPRAAAYASSKAAVRNHTKTVALYCAEEGLPIRCNSINPAAILTPIWEPMLGEGAAREAAMKAVVMDCPMKRFGAPEEVAAVAVMLAGDEAAYVNGTEIVIDGGILAGAAATPAPPD